MDSRSGYHRHLFRSERYANIGGVCAGIALARGYSVILTRIAALFLFSIGVGFLIYIALWLLLPSASQAQEQEPLELPHDMLYRSSEDRMIAGVCGGLAEYLRIDPNIIRVVYLVLVFTGVSLIPYLYAWIVIPIRSSHKI